MISARLALRAAGLLTPLLILGGARIRQADAHVCKSGTATLGYETTWCEHIVGSQCQPGILNDFEHTFQEWRWQTYTDGTHYTCDDFVTDCCWITTSKPTCSTPRCSGVC